MLGSSERQAHLRVRSCKGSSWNDLEAAARGVEKGGGGGGGVGGE